MVTIYKKHCVICGKEFETKDWTRQTCSRKCGRRNAVKNMKIFDRISDYREEEGFVEDNYEEQIAY